MLSSNRSLLNITQYIRRGGLWMLDLVLLAVLSPYVSDVWAYITSPSITLGYRVIIFIIGVVGFALFTFYLLMRRWGMLKSIQKETSVDVYSHSNLPSLDDIFTKVDRMIHLLGITLEGLSSKIPLIENLIRNNKRIYEELQKLNVATSSKNLICSFLFIIKSSCFLFLLFF